MKTQKWIGKMKLRRGALHKKLGVPMGKKIPMSRLQKASHSSNPTTRKQAVLAETFRSFKR